MTKNNYDLPEWFEDACEKSLEECHTMLLTDSKEYANMKEKLTFYQDAHNLAALILEGEEFVVDQLVTAEQLSAAAEVVRTALESERMLAKKMYWKGWFDGQEMGAFAKGERANRALPGSDSKYLN